MFEETWAIGIFVLAISTIMRYVLIKNDSPPRGLVQLISLNSQIRGAEALVLMMQLVGVTWIILGIIFVKIPIPNAMLKFLVGLIVFFGPLYLYGWLLSAKIRNHK